MNKKKYVTVTFQLEIDTNDAELNVKAISALNNYILASPIEFLNSNRPYIKHVTSHTDINPPVQKENAKLIPITEIPDQISALLITWEYEGQHTKRYPYGKTLHIDAEAMNKFIDDIIPNVRHDTVSKITYHMIKQDIVDITNPELIKQLKSEKTLIFKRELPNFN